VKLKQEDAEEAAAAEKAAKKSKSKG